MNATLEYFLPYQLAWINDPAPMAMGEKSRRIGWTYASSYRAVERRVAGKGNLYFSSADLTAAREFVDYCKTWCGVFNVAAAETIESQVIDDAEITSLVLTFAAGNKIVAGSSNPKFFRSKGGDADGDEFAFHREPRELLKAMHATALFWGHQLRLWSTHNGPGNYFNQLIGFAKAGKLKASLHKTTILDAVDQGLVEKIKHLKARDDKARQEWLDELRATCPDDDTWNEEYMCIPCSDQSSLLNYAMIGACEEANLTLWDELSAIPAGKTLYAGFDVGRKRDLSVLWVLERIGDVFWTRILRPLEKMNFTAQEDLLNQLMHSSSVKRLCIDSTGIGAMLSERLGQRFGSYRAEAVNFSAPVKAELAMPLLRAFQDRLVRIPASSDVREDLHKVRRTVTAAGNVRFEADRDDAGHADRFWALGLALHAADALRLPLPAPMARKPVGW